MKSFRQMTDEGVIKRADSEKIEYHNLHIEPGFNAPGRTDNDDEEDDSLYLHICAGGLIPQLEVRPREEGGVWIVDGHRRHKQIGRAIAAGNFPPNPKDKKFWITVRQFEGNDIKRTTRILTSNRAKGLTPLQLSAIYPRYRGFGMSPEEIAVEIGKSISHVKQILDLADSNSDVQKMVSAGEVSATLAIQMQRQEGENAGPKLKAAHAKIIAAGGTKVTPSAISAGHVSKRDMAVAVAICTNFGISDINQDDLKAIIREVK